MMKQNLDRCLNVYRVAYQLQNKCFCEHRNFADATMNSNSDDTLT